MKIAGDLQAQREGSHSSGDPQVCTSSLLLLKYAVSACLSMAYICHPFHV